MKHVLLRGLLNRSLIRIFDVLLSLFGLLAALPVLLVVALWIKLDSKGSVLYKQWRVGKSRREFLLYKFRTMHVNADKLGLITVGSKDPRVTKAGYLLRRFKLDELPQLFNVLKGEMSFVGPRPEVKRYTELYSPQHQMIVFSVRPGITDYATIEYSNENAILSHVTDPEHYYVHEVLPAKIRLNLIFIENPTFANYLRIIFRTISKIITH